MSKGALGHWEYDVAENVFTFNDAFYAIFHTTAQRVGGYQMSPAEYAERFVHPDDRHLVELETRNALATKDPHFSRELEHKFVYEDGGVGLLSVRFFIVKDAAGRTIRTYGINQDITDQRTAEDRLRESEARYRTLFDTTTDGILVTEVATKKLRYGNASICRMLGHNQDELQTLRMSDIHPNHALPEVIAIFEAQSRGETIFASELPCIRKDGELIYADISANIMNLDGRPCWVGFYRDVTERRHMRAQLAQADRLSTMGALAAGVAHEINNPLSYVMYNLESLSDELPGLLDAMRRYQAEAGFGATTANATVGAAATMLDPSVLDQIQQRFQEALGGTRRIQDISKSLGTFSRVERDEIVPVDLMDVIEAATKMCFNELKYRARLVKTYGKVPTVMASEGRLSQVFVNLLLNAAHSIDEGNFEGNEIRVRTWAEDDMVCAEVCDTGKGIAPEHMGRLFEPFFTTKEIGAGSGLGLSISKTIVEGYGGTITVRSEVAGGTAFLVRLPVGATEVASSRPSVVAEPRDQVRGRILIVDDEDGFRTAMSQMLCDHVTVEASTGEEARQILQGDQAFDLIVCDVMMPGVSGMDLHAWLSELNPQLAGQVIFVTGGAFTPRAREYLGRIDNIRLEKPFDVADFKKIVRDRVRIARSTILT